MSNKILNLEQAANLLQLFKGTSNHIRKKITKLEQQSCQKLGSTHFLLYKSEWTQLSSKISKLSKTRQLKCLKDRNHRKLMIQFVRHRAVNLYNLSYFNGAKISDHYIAFLSSSSPYIFTEILVIVNKMNLIHKHFKNKYKNRRFGENHIDIKIMKILELCQNDQRKSNMNIDKFKAITQFEEDMNQITLQLGKMLRKAWIQQKSKIPLQLQMSYISSQHSFFHYQNEVEEIDRGQEAESQQINFGMQEQLAFPAFVRAKSIA